jgi:competence protein ComEC
MLKGRQLLILWSAFLIGVVLADQLVVGERFFVLVLLVAFVSAALWRSSNTSRLQWLTLSLTSLCLLVGVVRMEYAASQFQESAFIDSIGQTVSLTGQVIREPDERETFTQLYVNVGDERVLVRTSRFIDVQYGDVVQVNGALDRPEQFETDTGRLFDYPNYLKVRDVQYIVSFAQVTVVETEGGNPVVGWLYEVKGHFAAAVSRSLPPPQSDLGLGLLLGVTQGLGDELEKAFRQTGLIHIVVLSGYNVMLVIGFFWWVSSWVLPLRGRVLLSLLGIVLFAIMVGLSATVVRASIMASILLFAKYIGARYDVLRALLFAGFVMVLINPYLLLYDLGFQLSFMATLGLVLFLPVFEEHLATKTPQVGLRDIFLATAVTQVFVLPLLIFHIGEVSVVAVVVNMLVLPIVAVVMALTFATGLLSMTVPVFVSPVALLTHTVLSYIILVVEWFAAWPWAAAKLPPITVFELLMMYAALFVVWYVWQSKKNSAAKTALPSDPPKFLR